MGKQSPPEPHMAQEQTSQNDRMMPPYFYHGKRDNLLMKGVALGVIPSRWEIMQTDASLLGWGAVWQHIMIKGKMETRASLKRY